MLTHLVVGLPHESGKGELAGPVLAMMVLNGLQYKTGFVSDMEMGIDNVEVVKNKFGLNDMNEIPSKACSRNIDILLYLDALKRKYGGILTVKPVKAHQDDKVLFEELGSKGKQSDDCDVVEKVVVSRLHGGFDVLHEYMRETLPILCSEKTRSSEDPCKWYIG